MASDVGRPLTAAPEHPTEVLASQPFAPGACRRQEPKEPGPRRPGQRAAAPAGWRFQHASSREAGTAAVQQSPLQRARHREEEERGSRRQLRLLQELGQLYDGHRGRHGEGRRWAGRAARRRWATAHKGHRQRW